MLCPYFVTKGYLELLLIFICRRKISTKKERSAGCEPFEVVNLSIDSDVLVEMEKFWASATNKERLQILSGDLFTSKVKESGKNLKLSGYVTDRDGICPSIAIEEEITHRPDLDCMTEEADSRLILHIAKAGEAHVRRIVVLSNDTDAIMYTLSYFDQMKAKGIEEIWVRYGVQNKTRDIPIHRLAQILGPDKCSALLKGYILTGCDVTSKVGSKAATVKAGP